MRRGVVPNLRSWRFEQEPCYGRIYIFPGPDPQSAWDDECPEDWDLFEDDGQTYLCLKANRRIPSFWWKVTKL